MVTGALDRKASTLALRTNGDAYKEYGGCNGVHRSVAGIAGAGSQGWTEARPVGAGGKARIRTSCCGSGDGSRSEHTAKRMKHKQQSTVRSSAAAVADPSLPNGVGIQGRGRAGMNIRLSNGGNCVAAMQQRKQSLMAAAEFRSSRRMVSVAAAGAGKFDEMPDRDDYPAGATGEAAFARDFDKFIDDNFDGKSVQLRTIDQHELKTGF